MLVTKDPLYSNVQSPTSAYLNTKTLQQASSVSLRLNEGLLSTPTNPHVNKLWTIKFYGRTLRYTTPDKVFHDTGLRKYFRNLLDYQVASGIIEPKDFSTYKFGKLYSMFQSFLLTYVGPVKNKQNTALIAVLRKLASTTKVSIKEVYIQANADNELVILKKGESGTHYIVVGDDNNDISYLFVSSTPGEYSSLHTSDKITLSNIIDSFSRE